MSVNPTKTKGSNKSPSGIQSAFADHNASLRRFISRFLFDPQDVEDVVQETFLKAYSAEQTKEIAQPKSFLFRIAKHIAISQLRRKSRHVTDYIEDLELLNVVTDVASAEDEVIAQQTLGLHCEALLELSPMVRKVYLMRKVYGMPYKDIAKQLNIAVSTVEKHLMKGVEVCDLYIQKKSGLHQDSSVPTEKRERNCGS